MKSTQGGPLPLVPLLAGVVTVVALGGMLWLGLRKSPAAPGAHGAAGSGAGQAAAKPVERVNEVVDPRSFRREGRRYGVKVLGLLKGRASHEDWGLETVMSVNYVVTLRYDETVIESRKDKLIVERHFLEARSRLFTSVEDFDLSKDMKGLKTFLEYVAVVEPRIGQGMGVAEKLGGKLKSKLLSESKRVGFDWSPVLARLDRDPGKLVRTLSRKLEGRKIKLLWTPGGAVQVLSGADGLPPEERRLLERASLLADGALFPNKNKRLGERWTVSAKHFSDFLDLGIDGALRGKVALRRGPDESIEGQSCARLEMLGGTIEVVADDAGRTARGSLTPEGLLYFDLGHDLISQARLSGPSRAQFASKKHLLFKARFKGTPRFTVSYEAALK